MLYKKLKTKCYICCLNIWDEAGWFLSLRFFGLLSSSLLLFPQRFGRHVLRPSSGVFRTLEPSRNFELRPLLNPRGYLSRLHGFNKGRSSKFRECSQLQQTPEEDRMTYRPKRCGNNNKDEDNKPKTLNDECYIYIYIYTCIYNELFFFTNLTQS